MKQARQIILLLFLLMPALVLAQEKDISRLIESIVESRLDVIDEQTDVGLMIEDLQYFAENPLNINDATPAQLLQPATLAPQAQSHHGRATPRRRVGAATHARCR